MVNTEFLKETVDCVDYILECYPELKPRGKRYTGCCPFHGEKTPSFFVDDRGFKCYGCGAGGDVVDFVMMFYKIDFHAAVEKIMLDNGLDANAVVSRETGARVVNLKADEYRRFGLTARQMKKLAQSSTTEHNAQLQEAEETIQAQLRIIRGNPLFADEAKELSKEYRKLLKKGLTS